MEYRKLSKDGPAVSALGFGAWPIGGGMGEVDREAAISTVRASVDLGITFIDTAQAYRTSETVLGRALKDGYRERCFLATKVSGDYSPDGIAKACENSLKELDVGCIDLYQIHSWNPGYPVEESMEAMNRLKDQGKIRYIGISNFTASQMARALKLAPVAANQIRYNLFDRGIEGKDIPFCEKNGIGILVHSPLAKGLLTGKYQPGHRFPEDDERSRFPRFQGKTLVRYLDAASRLAGIASEKGLSLVQLAIAWALRVPAVSSVLVGAKSPEQVREHLGALGVEFSQEELERIDAIAADVLEL